MKSTQLETSRFNHQQKNTLFTLLAFSVIWFPASLFLNPGWGTLGLIANPLMLIASLIPVAVIAFVNALQPNGKPLPKLLFRLEIAFCALWILLWCFMVNGGDTQDSMHSIFSRSFSSIWGEQPLVNLSGRLFGCTIFAMTVLAFVMAAYQRRDRDVKRAVWGRRLLIANFTYFLISFSTEQILASFGIFINPYWTWFYAGLDIAACLLGLLNVVYLLRYFSTHEHAPPKIWVVGVAAILASLYYVWAASNMLIFFLRLGHA